MTAEKDVQVARKKGRGGGEEIWAMPERKHSFLHEVFPKAKDHTFSPFLFWNPSLINLIFVYIHWFFLGSKQIGPQNFLSVLNKSTSHCFNARVERK